MSITFKVAEDILVNKQFCNIIDTKSSIKNLCKIDPEACGSNSNNIVDYYPNMNGFLKAIHLAFDEHYPLVLSPDDVWVAIAQGFSNHINAHSEELRNQFVNFEGKKYIEILRNSFIKGSPNNDWIGGFSEFSDKISQFIGDKRDLFVSNFSTTGIIEKAASEVILMDSMKAYFDYGCKTCCGIPEITLLGTEDDWSLVINKSKQLAQFETISDQINSTIGISDSFSVIKWTNSLVGVLNNFIQAFKGNIDFKFWNSLCKFNGGSGGPFVNGAVNVFFPYVLDYSTEQSTRINKESMNWEKGGYMSGPHPDNIPCGLSSVPFKWIYYEEIFPMQFLGGFVGTSQDTISKAVRPALGWGVADKL